MGYRLALLILLILPSPGMARTWFVERNGGGDFVVVQEALDAAASGDTIRIGPGRFDESRIYGSRRVCGFVDLGVITIIGSGIETVIGGEQPWDPDGVTTHGLEVSPDCSVVRVRNCTFEHFQKGLMMESSDSLFVADCEFRESQYNIVAGSRFSRIEDSRFLGLLSGGMSVLSYFQDRVIMDNCFSATDVQHLTKHVQVEGPVTMSIANSRFLGASAGITLSRGPHAEIRGCEFVNQSNYGINMGTSRPSCVLADCVFRDQGRALIGSPFPGASWYVDRVVFESVSHSTLHVLHLQDGYFHDCQLAAGAAGIVSNTSFPNEADDRDMGEPSHFDMRSNWWGTSNPDSIATLIYDYNDDDLVYYMIDFHPFLDGPTDVESRSLGDIKSLFR